MPRVISHDAPAVALPDPLPDSPPESLTPGSAADPAAVNSLSSPEEQYLAATQRAHRRRFGQFFTPPAYARLMAEWVAGKAPRKLLDPAVGTGLLLSAAQEAGISAALTGHDLEPVLLHHAATRLPDATLHQDDFLASDPARQYDAIIANPPYVPQRSHQLSADQHRATEALAGHRLSGRANLYAHFLIRIGIQLAPGGRAAVLLPAEWANANFGQPLKAFLHDHQLLRQIITIDQSGLAFADNQATAMILLLERPATRISASTISPVISHHAPTPALPASLAALDTDPAITRHALDPETLAEAPKWDPLLRPPIPSLNAAPAIGAGSTLPDIELGHLLTVKRGIATGCNAFFLLRPSQARTHGLEPARCTPCVAKAAQAPGAIFTARDWQQLFDNDAPCLLFNPPADPAEQTPAERAYLVRGVEMNVPQRHGPRTKPIWYRAETRAPAPIWAVTFGRGNMRFVFNQTASSMPALRSLTCFHQLVPRADPATGEPLLGPRQCQTLAAHLNSPAMAPRIAAEQRRYAGGLLKLEPRDLLAIRVPDLRLANAG